MSKIAHQYHRMGRNLPKNLAATLPSETKTAQGSSFQKTVLSEISTTGDTNTHPAGAIDPCHTSEQKNDVGRCPLHFRSKRE